MAGQMGLSGRIGRMLYSLASRDDVRRCLEVGTSNGEGSTLCLATGLVQGAGTLTTIEADAEMHKAASRFYRHRKLPVDLVHGATLVPEDYLPYEAYLPRIELAQYEREAPGTHRRWYDAELHLAASAPRRDLLRDMLAQGARFDLVLLDGGEFSSSAELELLEPAIDGWLVLDDTNPVRSIKNAENRERVLASSDWEVLVDEQDDRCGWLAAKRRRR